MFAEVGDYSRVRVCVQVSHDAVPYGDAAGNGVELVYHEARDCALVWTGGDEPARLNEHRAASLVWTERSEERRRRT